MIAFQHVSIARTGLSGRSFSVEDVSFEIQRGEIFGIAGPQGTGKSALLHTVNGLVLPSQGDVVVDGLRVPRLSSADLRAFRRRVGLVPSSPALLNSLSLKENIALPLISSGIKGGEAGARAEEMLSLAGLDGLGATYPAAITKEQQKRAAIARAIAAKPEILLCVEPPHGLTPAAGESILSLLDKIHGALSLTLVLSTQDLQVVKRLCGRAAMMQDGKVVELGDTYSLFSTPKHSFTREFLAQQLSFDLPPDVRDHAFGTIVAIEYMGDPANEPVLYETAQRFGVEFNILQGRIEYIGGKPLGKMYVSFNAEPALMVNVLSYLKEHTYRAEVMADV